MISKRRREMKEMGRIRERTLYRSEADRQEINNNNITGLPITKYYIKYSQLVFFQKS